MIVSVTYIKLKSPFKFFSLSYAAMHVMKDLKKSNAIAYKTRGFWVNHYTITAWETEEDMRLFMHMEGHAKAMTKTTELASTLKFFKKEMDTIPNWKTAKKMVQSCKPRYFK